MGSAVITEVDPISDCSCCVLKAFEAMTMNALLFESSYHAFDHSILLRTVRRNKLLPWAIASDETRVVAARNNQSIFGPQQEWVFDLAQRVVAGNQGLLESSACS